CQQYSKLPPTF
nr:immunoglobulin light chain junction region [Mus musculus]NSM01630.1 immunoglobulin light chain junction region [Mus musculus]